MNQFSQNRLGRFHRKPFRKMRVTKPNREAGLRHPSARKDFWSPLAYAGRACASKAEVELSRPRAIMRANMLDPPKAPSDIRIYEDRLRPLAMRSAHGEAPLPSGRAPRNRPRNARPRDTAEGIASGDEVNYRERPAVFLAIRFLLMTSLGRNSTVFFYLIGFELLSCPITPPPPSPRHR